MENIVYPTVYDLVSQELGQTVAQVREQAARDGEGLLRSLATDTLPGTGVVLAAPVPSPEGRHALLSQGTELGCKLDTLLRRQLKNPSQTIGPISLVPTTELLFHYRRKVDGRFGRLREGVRSPSNPVWRRVLLGLPSTGQYLVEDGMDKALAGVTGSSKGLNAMLRATCGDHNRRQWGYSINATMVAMAIALRQKQAQKNPHVARSKSLRVLGEVGILQDLSLMTDLDERDRDEAQHAERSADFAAELGFHADVVGTVRNHHRTTDQDGTPILRSKIESVGWLSRVAVAANMFAGEVTGDRGTGRDAEVVKGMYHLAALGHLDRKVVNTLTQMYFPRKAAAFLEKANEIAMLCQHRGRADPILWSLLGGRNPCKFICDHAQCIWLGSQTTVLAANVPIQFRGEVVATIPKGAYQDCRFLNRALARLHKDAENARIH